MTNKKIVYSLVFIATIIGLLNYSINIHKLNTERNLDKSKN